MHLLATITSLTPTLSTPLQTAARQRAAALSFAADASEAAGSGSADSIRHAGPRSVDGGSDESSVGSAGSGGGPPGAEYRFYTEFQSHEPEFDYLKSLQVRARVGPGWVAQVRWTLLNGQGCVCYGCARCGRASLLGPRSPRLLPTLLPSSLVP